jgi:hypothetical protein
MKRFGLFLLVLLAFGCKDPFDYEPGDPTKPDPPAAPALYSPADGYNTGVYVYPQDVELVWKAVAGAEFYQVRVYSDSMLQRLAASNDRARAVSETFSLSFSKYYWRVRAVSRQWNDYTDWSATWTFIIPSPSR